MDATKPYEFIGFGAMDATKPYEFIGFRALFDRALLETDTNYLRPMVQMLQNVCFLVLGGLLSIKFLLTFS